MSSSQFRFAGVVLCTTLLVCTQARAQLFTQQGGKLVGSGFIGMPLEGISVALSSNGNTALVGGPNDNGNSNAGVGGVWVFARGTSGNWTQQGSKLIGTGATGPASQGGSVALSADGNTALVGGATDNNGFNTFTGAVWVFTRDVNGNWTQEGSKLVGSGADNAASQGTSVALSADGNTALVGGPDDDNGAGAVWVFTRDRSGNWTQQGSKLVGGGAYGAAAQGMSVAISTDGNTAVLGGPQDDAGIGAMWVFTRDTNGNWAQQGSKLVSANPTTYDYIEGSSVAISADGNTALMGGPGGNGPGGGSDPGSGGAWVFTRDGGGNWSQQGGKLVGDGTPGANLGWSVALSGDGKTALVGGPADTSGVGAVWVFGRDNNGNWSQLGTPLVGSGGTGDAEEGRAVALSGDGNTAMAGGPFDGGIGAAWVFVRNGSSQSSSPSFTIVPGALQEISVGADGSVWGLNSSQQIFTYSSSGWTNIPGTLSQIAVASSTAVWGLNEQGQIYHWDSAHSDWINVPGTLAQIVVAADGDVWGLNAQSNIYHYNAQIGSFVQVPGQLAHLAVGSAGAVYGINSSGAAFWYNPGTGYFQYLANPAFTQIAVGSDGYVVGLNNGIGYGYEAGSWIAGPTDVSIAQVAVGSGGSIYALDASGNIYFYNGQSRALVQIPGTLSSISVGGSGAVWGLNSAQEIFTLQNAPTRGFQALTSVPGSFSQISVGADGSVWGVSGNAGEYFNPATQTFLAVSVPPALAQISVGAGGNVWALDTSGSIYQWDPSSRSWNNIPGQLNFIQLGADHSVWGINSAGLVFTYNFSNNTWANIPGALQTLSVGADGTVWGLNAQQQIYRFDGVGSWVNVPGALVQISVGNANNVWGVNAEHQIYRYDLAANRWVSVPGTLMQVKVAFDGSVWGVNAAGDLYQWNAGAQSFSFVGSGVTDVFVGNAAAVWAFNATTGAVFSWF